MPPSGQSLKESELPSIETACSPPPSVLSALKEGRKVGKESFSAKGGALKAHYDTRNPFLSTYLLIMQYQEKVILGPERKKKHDSSPNERSAMPRNSRVLRASHMNLFRSEQSMNVWPA